MAKATTKDKQIHEWRMFNNKSAVTQPTDNDDFNPQKEIMNKLKQAKERAKAISEYKTVRTYLPKDEREMFDKELGLVKDDEESIKETVDDNMPLIIEMMKNEKDPKIRQQLAMAMMSKKGGMDSNMMLLASMMGNQNQNESSFEKEIIRDMMKEKLLGKNDSNQSMKDTIEMFRAMQELVGGGNQGDPLDDLIEKKKKMEDLGLVGKTGNSIEDKRFDLELKKFEYEKDRESSKDEADAELKKKAITEGIKAFPNILNLLSKNNQNNQVTQVEETPVQEEPPQEQFEKQPVMPQQQPEPIDAMDYTCQNPECKRTFKITHLNEPRMLACPNLPDRKCNRVYELTDDGKLGVYELTGDDLEKMILENGGEPLDKEDETKHDRQP